MDLFDTHAHLDAEPFREQQDAVIARAHAAGVTRMLAVGTTATSSLACCQLAEQGRGIFAAVGIHPTHLLEAAAEDWEQIVALATRPEVVALGETGLDLYWKETPLALQQDYFDRHLRLSQQMQLPLVIHQRDSAAEILTMLQEARRRGPLRGIMHSFAADAETAAACLELGLHLSFAGMVTFKNADDLRAIAKTVPQDRLLIETDAPYLTPHPFRGRRPNEPAYVVHTATCLAEVRGISLAELARITTENACRLLRR